MNRLSGRSVGSIFALVLGTWMLFMGLNPVAEGASTLTLEQPVHFMASDGSDVLVGIGTHEVDTLVGSRLRLNTEGGETVFLDAQATTHSGEIEAPLAVTINGEDPDVVHVVLLLSNGQALDAPGSISGTRSRGLSTLLISSAQIKFAVAQKGPVVRDHRTPPALFSRIEYLGNYPSHRSPGWSSELQGLAHDNQNWFITQKSRLWKFPLTHDLNRQVAGPDPARGILAVGIPDSLKRVGYYHFGDLDQYGGFLFIPLEGSQTPRIAVFHAHDLSFVGSFVLSGQKKAGWCALRVESGSVFLYTSNDVIDRANPIFRYRVDVSQLNANPGNAFRFANHVVLLQGNTPLDIKPYLQGGEFSPDGSHFFIVNGKNSGFSPRDGGIWVFRGTPFQYVTKSTEKSNSGSFFFEFHPGWSKYEEPEGITFWNLDGRQAPGVSGGQLHVILLDNDISSGDEIYIKHYRLVR